MMLRQGGTGRVDWMKVGFMEVSRLRVVGTSNHQGEKDQEVTQ